MYSCRSTNLHHKILSTDKIGYWGIFDFPQQITFIFLVKSLDNIWCLSIESRRALYLHRQYALAGALCVFLIISSMTSQSLTYCDSDCFRCVSSRHNTVINLYYYIQGHAIIICCINTLSRLHKPYIRHGVW